MKNARSTDMERLERMLRDQADAAREVPPEGLRGRILEALDSEPVSDPISRSGAWRGWLAAAVVIALAWTARVAFRSEAPEPADDMHMASIVDVGSNVRWLNAALVEAAKGAFDQEAKLDDFVTDATRAASSLLDDLQRPLRSLRSDAR